MIDNIFQSGYIIGMNSLKPYVGHALPQFYRQRFLVALLQIFDNQLNNTDFQKLLFLFNQMYRKEQKLFYFVPYKFGPFSFQAYADIRRLCDLSIFEGEKPIRCVAKTQYISLLNESDQNNLRNFHHEFKSLLGEDLIRFIYDRYPFYAKNSEIKKKMTGLNINAAEAITNYGNVIFTLGYEGKTIDEYLNILVQYDIKALIDVRKNPISMKYGFSKKTLQKALMNLKIDYQHYPELGIESANRKELSTLETYQALFKEYENTVLKESSDTLNLIYHQFLSYERIVLLCFEKDPQYCHRSRISNRIEQLYGVSIRHL